MTITGKEIEDAARDCLVRAGTTFRDDQIRAYREAMARETNRNARWVMEQLLQNAEVAQEKCLPLCDDTGIPHVMVKAGDNCRLPSGWLTAIKKGVALGLRQMPGRPMAVRGNGVQRVEQSQGLYDEPDRLEPAPVLIRSDEGKQLAITILMLGGGPEIRAKTRRVFHRRSIDHVLEEAASWLIEEMASLGCTPAVPAIGIGRSQMEASSLMLEAMAEGSLDQQSPMEKRVTDAVNASRVGPLGLGGDVTALGTFLKIGPARASGVRIVSVRPCCCMEPRRATVVLG